MNYKVCFVFMVTGPDFLSYSSTIHQEVIGFRGSTYFMIGYLLNSLTSSIPSLSNSLGIDVYVLILVFVIVSV